MNGQLHIFKGRGIKYTPKNTSWHKIRPSHKNAHLWQFLEVDNGHNTHIPTPV